MGETAKDRAGGAQDAIRHAVLRLAARKPLHKISVTEICREAPVHRSTFYKYYGSPYDVMGEIQRLLVAHTAESVMHSLQAGANMHDALCNALKYVRENQETVRLLLKLGDYSLFQEVKDQLPDFHSVLKSRPVHRLSSLGLCTCCWNGSRQDAALPRKKKSRSCFLSWAGRSGPRKRSLQNFTLFYKTILTT